MAHKDLDKRARCNRRSYEKNKTKCDERARLRKQRLRNLAISLHTPCVDCGTFNPAFMDFHHIDPSTKDGEVMRLVNHGCAQSRILEEIAKCISLCANCHRLRHFASATEGT